MTLPYSSINDIAAQDNVGVGDAFALGDLAVAVARCEQGEVARFASSQRGEDLDGRATVERVLERRGGCEPVFPRCLGLVFVAGGGRRSLAACELGEPPPLARRRLEDPSTQRSGPGTSRGLTRGHP